MAASNHLFTSFPCSSCNNRSRTCCDPGMSRRSFLASGATAVITPLAAASQNTVRQAPIAAPLKIQPVLTYEIPSRREATSYRPWGGLLTEQDAAAERERIGAELKALSRAGGFQFQPLVSAQTPEQAARIAREGHDVVLMYAASGGGKTLEALVTPDKWSLMFLRHRSGPVYLWYEIAHPRFLRKTVDEFGQPGMTVRDVVVDSQTDLAGKLRGLYGLKNTLGKRMVAVGGPSGWGAGGRLAPDHARNDWKFDLRTVSYDELGERIQKARADERRVKRCDALADDYLAQKEVSLETSRAFVRKAFLLTDVFRGLLDEAQTDALTVNQCMGTIMKVSETTACLPLSILNDEGYMAFCESDFVVIPSGVLLHYISGKPVFLNDPTHPHHGVVTLAHCTAPRKMDGRRAEPVRVLTHFESDYGAAPKVEMTKGQVVTNLIPDFGNRNWTGFEGEIIDNPFMPICRSQIDVRIKGDTDTLLEEMKGFHWMTSYGSYLRETQYALSKIGVGMKILA